MTPESIEAETAVIGILISEPEKFSTIAGQISFHDFSRPTHQKIFSAIVDLHRKGIRGDLIALTDALQNKRQLENIGGASYLVQLCDSFISSVGLLDYVSIVRKTATKRQIFKLSEEIQALSKNGQEPGFIIEELEKRIQTIKNGQNSNAPLNILGRLRSVSDIRAMDLRVEWAWKGAIPDSGITGLTGRAGMGKTSLMYNIITAIVAGRSYLGLETKQMPGYYLDYENPIPVVKDGLDKLNASGWNYMHAAFETPPRIDSDEWALLKKLPPGFVVIDSLRSANALDLNNDQDVAFLMMRLKELRDIGFTILFLMHTTKTDERGYRGSMALIDMADQVLSFYPVRSVEDSKAVENVDEVGDLPFYLGTKEKTRYEPFKIYIERSGDRLFTLAEDPKVGKMEAIRDLLRGKEPMNQKALLTLIKNELGFTGDKNLQRLLKSGEEKLWKVTPGPNGHSKMYQWQNRS